MLPTMSERAKDLLSFTAGPVLTLATLFLVMSWDFRAADIAVAIVFALGVAVGIWAMRVWYGIGRRQ